MTLQPRSAGSSLRALAPLDDGRHDERKLGNASRAKKSNRQASEGAGVEIKGSKQSHFSASEGAKGPKVKQSNCGASEGPWRDHCSHQCQGGSKWRLYQARR